MYLQKVIIKKTCWHLGGPDPLVRCMDPRIRIRIHTKISWIRDTVRCTDHKITFKVCNTQTCMYVINPILHTWFGDGSSTIQFFPLLFNTGMVILLLKVLYSNMF